ncbi:MAG TPA: GNAT family N-acetyltransferase [Deltaproteobacteria bacterium]|nr:GNAT family N-acetyltransferase [Deltaproteobacteria bacterium]HOM28632.1 GNAT family N-acetyltransferase [Deltaproteobacteria bacterium]HPP81380.1 GNAT family N-acetyltransferase [Deltaproteobacteria bacterium]
MALSFRPARTQDLEAVFDVYRESLEDVYVRHGFDPPHIHGKVNPFHAFCLESEPGGFFVAEEEGEIVGASLGWARGRLWFLSHLFVRPHMQRRGIGGTLLELARTHAGESGADIEAVVTMAFNPVSVGLYLGTGMLTVTAVLLMKMHGRPAPDGVTNEDAGGVHETRPEVPVLEFLDAETLGFSRGSQHRFLLGLEGAGCTTVLRGTTPAAYAYHFADGRIGPACALDEDSLERALRAATAQAAGVAPTLSLMVPTSNRRALKTAVSLGFRPDVPYVLLSSRPFGSFERYLLHSPGMM